VASQKAVVVAVFSEPSVGVYKEGFEKFYCGIFGVLSNAVGVAGGDFWSQDAAESTPPRTHECRFLVSYMASTGRSWVLGGMGTTAGKGVACRGVYGVFLVRRLGRSVAAPAQQARSASNRTKKIIPLDCSTTGTG